MSETLSSEQRWVRQSQSMFNGEETYDNRTEKYIEVETTYREGKHKCCRHKYLLGRRPRVSVIGRLSALGGRDRERTG